MSVKIVPVILSGGAGSRLWPVSRQDHPKPFMKLGDGQSLLQKTYIRAIQLDEVSETLTVTNRDYYFKTKDEYAEIGDGVSVKNTYLLEPFGRNTAPAIAMACLRCRETYNEDVVLLILPADHLIEKSDVFSAAVKRAVSLAENNKLCTFGVIPDRPETGFGYIECGEPCDNEGSSSVVKFHEKPSREVAEEFVSGKRHLWNSGMFCFSAAEMLRQFEICAPELLNSALECWEQSKLKSADWKLMTEIDAETFGNLENISIDYAIMEKAKNVAVTRGDFGWSDIGSWEAVSLLTPADDQGNRVQGDAILVDTADTYVRAEDRMVTTVGIHDVMVIDTPDALLIADNSRTQDVKKVVEKLKERGHESFRFHRTVARPWGAYTVLEEGAHYKIKRIEVKPGASLSLQMHHHRSEHWIVVRGTANIVNGEKEFLLQANESTFIPATAKHRLENPGVLDLVLIEVQSGDYLGEDDIVRFEDMYGRTN